MTCKTHTGGGEQLPSSYSSNEKVQTHSSLSMSRVALCRRLHVVTDGFCFPRKLLRRMLQLGNVLAAQGKQLYVRMGERVSE